MPTTIALVPAEPVLLLTATIDPRACINTQRSDPGQRTTDYRQALQAWLAHGWFRRIVVAENSGADPILFAAEAAALAERDVAFEFLACPPGDQDQARGKGFGEMGIIAAALVRAVHAALAAGEHLRPLPCAPRIVGVGATDNRTHRLSLGKRIRHALMRRILAF